MPNEKVIEITECPRDAMQGWPNLIATENKIAYLRSLLKVGFNTLDCGSFVSPKAIPQMADSAEVFASLPTNSSTQLLAIVANIRGAQDAMVFENIAKVGYPFSLSETFQLRNTNASIAASFETAKELQEICLKNNKKLVVYFSMAFGNPYGDTYTEETVLDWVKQFTASDLFDLSLADTVGMATPGQIESLVQRVIAEYPSVQLGVHLHAAKAGIPEKIDAALSAGCRRFDGALKGIGGCPMSGSDLVGNMDTEMMVAHFLNKGYNTNINLDKLAESSRIAAEIFV